MLLVAGVAAFVGAGGVFLDALFGDADGVGALAGGGAGEGAEELVDVEAAVMELAVDGGVEGGEEFFAEFVENFVYVDVGQRVASPLQEL